MSAITLTPVDPTTAAVVVNSDILYHVFTINGVTRVLFSKGGKSPYQIDVQETASAIAALCPNLVEVTTVNGTEYLFIGSGGTGPGLGIMFIENDGTGSKITFRYTEESGNTMFYSSDSPSVIAGRINAQTPSTNPTLTVTVPISNSECISAATNPVLLIPSPGPGYAIAITSAFVDYQCTVDFDNGFWIIAPPSSLAFGQYSWYSNGGSTVFSAMSSNVLFFSQTPALTSLTSYKTIYENEDVKFYAAADSTVGDGTYVLTLNYQIISVQ